MRFPDPREEPVLLVEVLVYAAVSSILGLTGAALVFSLGAMGFVVGMWVQYPAAALAFLAGSSLTGLAALGLAREERWGASLGTGLAGTVVTYWLSFLIAQAVGGLAEGGVVPSSPLDALTLVVGWGIAGIAFATVVPAAWARWGEDRLHSAAGGPGGTD